MKLLQYNQVRIIVLSIYNDTVTPRTKINSLYCFMICCTPYYSAAPFKNFGTPLGVHYTRLKNLWVKPQIHSPNYSQHNVQVTNFALMKVCAMHKQCNNTRHKLIGSFTRTYNFCSLVIWTGCVGPVSFTVLGSVSSIYSQQFIRIRIRCTALMRTNSLFVEHVYFIWKLDKKKPWNWFRIKKK